MKPPSTAWPSDAERQQHAEPREVAAERPAAEGERARGDRGEPDEAGEQAVAVLDPGVGLERRRHAAVALGPVRAAEPGAGEPHRRAREDDQRQRDERELGDALVGARGERRETAHALRIVATRVSRLDADPRLGRRGSRHCRRGAATSAAARILVASQPHGCGSRSRRLSAAVTAMVLACILYRVWNLRWSVPINEDRVRHPLHRGSAQDDRGDRLVAAQPEAELSLRPIPGGLPDGRGVASAHRPETADVGDPGLRAGDQRLLPRGLRCARRRDLSRASATSASPFRSRWSSRSCTRTWPITSRTRRCTSTAPPTSPRRSPPCCCCGHSPGARASCEDPDPPTGVLWWRNLRRGRVAAAVGLALVIGISETITTAFTMALLGAAAIVAAVRWREPQRLAVAGC